MNIPPIQQGQPAPIAGGQQGQPAPAANIQQQAIPGQNLPLVQAVPIFSLTPAQSSNAIIDHSTKYGLELYYKSIYKLQEELFSVEEGGLHTFLNALYDRSIDAGWDSILSIPSDVNFPDDDLIDLIANYGEVTMEQIRDHTQLYAGIACRAAQDSRALYTCLMNSLSIQGKNKITLYKADYHANRQPVGALLLKVIIRECRLDTRATDRHLRNQLTDLTDRLKSMNYDIPMFNLHILGVLAKLRARGGTTIPSDLLAHLFKAYERCPDQDFVIFIKHRKQAYDMGQDFEPQDLMQYAQIQYQIQVQDGTWQKPSADQERIVALEAQFSDYKKKHPSSGPGNGRSGGRTGSSQGRGGGGRGNGKGRGRGKARNTNSPAPAADWKLKAPKDNEKNKPIKKDGKTFWWCPNHKKWGTHKLSQCHLAPGNTSNTATTPATNQSTNSSQTNQLRLTSALTRIQEEEE